MSTLPTSFDFIKLSRNKMNHLSLPERNNVISESNNAQRPDDKLKLMNENMINSLCNHLYRPLPTHLRARQLNANEWFSTESNDVLFN
ncbi:unnamed protein product [Rotaria magnacalcarata]|uniref:Uncharacterized protein n=1 Tax=Rotaria magnacalcarata TaxID=392030 RepID=A0A815D6H1_9BILA|nr:unnamed protein product [Rotaria magnacalcarata]CAF3778713.1 unnamed protein product [Rotaria magnacalcarata]CAF3798200.1 unnamed protein product [Rotaria magnacalcarata]CAF4011067.1 unnamed protein product [Rotaria magnacalcarata]CAF4168652.1 unnamed protein product [Rotaria magnacalcarata]